MAEYKRRFPRRKKRDTLKGGRRGRPADAGRAKPERLGLFYALRACVRVVLGMMGGRPGDETAGAITKLELWLKEADAWQVEVPVREPEPEGRELLRLMASGQSGSPVDGRLTRNVHRPRKARQPPGWHEPELTAEQAHAVAVVEAPPPKGPVKKKRSKKNGS